jgi:hypothetical protein
VSPRSAGAAIGHHRPVPPRDQADDPAALVWTATGLEPQVFLDAAAGASGSPAPCSPR